MDTTKRHPTEQPASGYERTDLSVRAIAAFAGTLVITTALTLVLMAWLLGYFVRLEMRADPPVSPLAETLAPTPEPRLQADPGRDLTEMRATEDALLNEYAWVDRRDDLVRIPITRAMELLAERGLAVRNDEAPTR
jgi:hypothetical protein